MPNAVLGIQRQKSHSSWPQGQSEQSLKVLEDSSVAIFYPVSNNINTQTA